MSANGFAVRACILSSTFTAVCMPKLAETIQFALRRKKVPAFNLGSTRDLARQLGMASPFSIRDLIGILNNLVPASKTFDAGTFTADTVHASAVLFVQSDGAVVFSGRVHESGVVGHHFSLAIALPGVQDASGKTIAFVHPDTIVGQLEVGFSDKNWNDIGFNQEVHDNWEVIQGIRTVLDVSTDPLQVTELALIGLFVAAGVAFGGIFIGGQIKQCKENGHWVCGWQPIGSGLAGPPGQPGEPGSPPGAGLEYVCRCEFN
jgi:hypothetical protein